MKIEWAADFHRDGSRRKHPIPNTMHGWLAKMRGTLIGDERLRSRGMREMKAAREYKRREARRKKQSCGFLANLFGCKLPPSRSSGTRSQPRVRHRGSAHRLVGHAPQRRHTTGIAGTPGRSKSPVKAPVNGVRRNTQGRGQTTGARRVQPKRRVTR
ncbi:uncharacterized protein BT62DRAFT_929007 [Guyanagaster necrorhizus]|uniref:Uncharacterized protein n=1 Tax=Guyanagaster necrorhizus TaxID=856835 RepID=A0A9P7VYZ2_9AGAR|nr:uncharacterized protein BT62DRAFT_929007 [Guyanagaster necrorhizus MCA 3950]KAG7449010.1 hypothetical protein BT62DRAFT_929007 [Guyanagaster necrorhizus MCA 3950]